MYFYKLTSSRSTSVRGNSSSSNSSSLIKISIKRTWSCAFYSFDELDIVNDRNREEKE
jgi:hypothetical protein